MKTHTQAYNFQVIKKKDNNDYVKFRGGYEVMCIIDEQKQIIEQNQALEEKDQVLVKTLAEFIEDPFELANKTNIPLDKVNTRNLIK